MKIAVTTASICGAIITIGMWAGSSLLTSIFINHADKAYNLAVKGLPYLGTCALFFAINITFIGYYQSREESIRSIIYMLLRGVIFMIPGFIILPHIFGADGLWLAIPMSELLTLMVISLQYLHNGINNLPSVRRW